MRSRRMIHLMREIHSTKKLVTLTIFKVTADFDLYIEIHCVKRNSPVAAYLSYRGIPNVLTINGKPYTKNPMVMLMSNGNVKFDLDANIKVKSNIVRLKSPVADYLS